MRYLSIFIISLMALTALSCAADTSTDPAFTGYRLAFQTGKEYQAIQDGVGNVSAYNNLVGQWNAFVQQNYGAESGLLMQTMDSTDVNLQKPYVSAVNATGNGIVHSIDGSGKYPPTYTTNDINQLSNYAIAKYASQDTQYDSAGNPIAGTRNMGDGYLGGV